MVGPQTGLGLEDGCMQRHFAEHHDMHCQTMPGRSHMLADESSAGPVGSWGTQQEDDQASRIFHQITVAHRLSVLEL